MGSLDPVLLRALERSYFDLPVHKNGLNLLEFKLQKFGLNDNSHRYVILATSSDPWEALHDYDYSLESIFHTIVGNRPSLPKEVHDYKELERKVFKSPKPRL
jgi:hypothetical protein